MSKTSFTREQAWNIAGLCLAIPGWMFLLEIESWRDPDPYSRESVTFALGYLAIALGAWITVRAVQFLIRVMTR